MSKALHRIILTLYVLIILTTIIILIYKGYSYYRTPISERYFHPDYEILKSSSFLGHGLGVIGTLIIVIGLFGYMARKRLKVFHNWGLLKYWLEFHIFLCTWGTTMVVFHSSFKLGGLISIGFWVLITVWVSGVIGRYIYLQIPRTIEGTVMNLNELIQLKADLNNELYNKYRVNPTDIKQHTIAELRMNQNLDDVSKPEMLKLKKLIRQRKTLMFRIKRLDRMKKLLKYWHVIHLPFALIMLVIMMIHVSIVMFFGYFWIF